jgi:hypothetical protein
MTERMSRPAASRRVTASHALVSFAAAVHRGTGQNDVTVDRHVSGDGTAGDGVGDRTPQPPRRMHRLVAERAAAPVALPGVSSAGLLPPATGHPR